MKNGERFTSASPVAQAVEGWISRHSSRKVLYQGADPEVTAFLHTPAPPLHRVRVWRMNCNEGIGEFAVALLTAAGSTGRFQMQQRRLASGFGQCSFHVERLIVQFPVLDVEGEHATHRIPQRNSMSRRREQTLPPPEWTQRDFGRSAPRETRNWMRRRRGHARREAPEHFRRVTRQSFPAVRAV
jgi:hypothetical protein